MVDRFPEFVGGADYARLNNLARTNSGLTPLYSEADIAAYEKGDPYDMLHPNVNYRDMLMKNSMAFRRANVSSTGGPDKVRYFAYVQVAEDEQNLWQEYAQLLPLCGNFAMRKVAEPGDIYPVFRDLFKNEGVPA